MRNMKQTQRRTVLTVAAIAVVVVLLWFGGLLALWPVLRGAGVSTEFWAMAQALTAIATMAAVLGGSVAAYRQLTEAAHVRHMAVADRLFEELNSPQNIDARRWVFRNLPDNPEEGSRLLTPEGQAALKLVLNSLDHVAFLTQTGWIPDEMIMPWMNPMIVKAWSKLEPYVDYESRKRREPDYYRHARELAERCRAWRAKNMPDAQIIWVDDAL